MRKPITRYAAFLSAAFAAAFALCESAVLTVMPLGAIITTSLLPTGIVYAVDADHDGYPKDTDKFYLFPAEDC